MRNLTDCAVFYIELPFFPLPLLTFFFFFLFYFLFFFAFVCDILFCARISARFYFRSSEWSCFEATHKTATSNCEYCRKWETLGFLRQKQAKVRIIALLCEGYRPLLSVVLAHTRLLQCKSSLNTVRRIRGCVWWRYCGWGCRTLADTRTSATLWAEEVANARGECEQGALAIARTLVTATVTATERVSVSRYTQPLF